MASRENQQNQNDSKKYIDVFKNDSSVKIGVYIRYQFSAVFLRCMATADGVALRLCIRV